MLTNEDMLKLADLAKLELSADEAAKLNEALSQNIDLLSKLFSCPDMEEKLEGVPYPLREDKVKPSFDREELLGRAPAQEAGCILVPHMKEGL